MYRSLDVKHYEHRFGTRHCRDTELLVSFNLEGSYTSVILDRLIKCLLLRTCVVEWLDGTLYQLIDTETVIALNHSMR